MGVKWYLVVVLISICLRTRDLTIFSCAYWPSVYSAGTNVCSSPLPRFEFLFCFGCCRVVGDLYIFWILHSFLFFPICMSFIDFSCVITVPITSSTLLNKNDVWTSLPCSWSSEEISLSPLSIMLGTSCFVLFCSLVDSVYQIEDVPFSILFWVSCHEKMLDFCQMLFMHQLIWPCDFYYLPIDIVHYIARFWILKQLCVPRTDPTGHGGYCFSYIAEFCLLTF